MILEAKFGETEQVLDSKFEEMNQVLSCEAGITAHGDVSHISNKNNPHEVTAEQVGARPNTWMPTANDVGARSNTWMPTASDVGARPDSWMPTASEVGARADTWTPTAAEVGARPDTWMPTASDVGAVSKTGDTMTGDLTTTAITISGGAPTITFNETDEKPSSHIVQSNRHYFRSIASDTTYYEQFRLPVPSTGLTGSKSYDILTTKSPVTFADGGTGATDRLEAAKNLSSEPVSTPNYVIGLTTGFANYGYTTIAQLRNTLGIKDYVTAQGTSGNWHYRKYNSGYCECWRTITEQVTASQWEAWGGIYLTPGISVGAFPFSVYSAVPNVTAHNAGNNTLGVVTASDVSATTMNEVRCFRGTKPSSTITVVYNIFVCGKWRE